MHGMHAKGSHSITWNGTDAYGRPVSAGVYILKVEAEGLSLAKRILKN
jgi:flagellar hook assembly protein FlgD